MTPFHFGESPEAEPGGRRIEIPAGLVTKAGLFDFLAKAFPLPAYFGHNWDALEECLLDLDWLAEPQVALIHHDIPPDATPDDQQIYLRILAETAQGSPRLRITFPAADQSRIERMVGE